MSSVLHSLHSECFVYTGFNDVRENAGSDDVTMLSTTLPYDHVGKVPRNGTNPIQLPPSKG